jgi:hypothetical protein
VNQHLSHLLPPLLLQQLLVYPRTVLLCLQTLLPGAQAAVLRRCLSFRHRHLRK